MPAQLPTEKKRGSRYYICFLLFFIISFSIYAQTDSSFQNVDSTRTDSSFHTLIQSSTQQAKQHLYKMNYWISGSFCAVATAANIYAIGAIIHGKSDMTDQQVLALNKNNVNWFDRWALEQDPSHRDAAYKFTDVFLTGLIAVSGGSLALDKKIRKDFFRIMMMYYEMHAITFAIYDFSPLGPAFQNRVRPISYYANFSMADRKAGNEKNSTYSGHVASGVASTFFAVKVYTDYHPELGGKKYLLYGLAALPPLFLGYMRVRALAHFPTDVLEGFAIGSVCGIVVPELHKNKKQNIQLSLYSSQFGQQGLTVRWQPAKKIKVLNDFRKAG